MGVFCRACVVVVLIVVGACEDFLYALRRSRPRGFAQPSEEPDCPLGEGRP